MKCLRIVLVTPRFWPLFGAAEDAVAELAVGLKQCGTHPTVLTASWAPHWAEHLSYRGVPVVRLPHPAVRGWGQWRYLAALARTLRRCRDAVDLVYVVGSGREVSVALAAARRRSARVVVRLDCETDSPGGSLASWATRHRCNGVDAVIAGDPCAAQAWADAGLATQPVCVIPDDVPATLADHDADRLRARSALAAANPDLTATADSSIVACVGRLAQGRGLLRLLEAWRNVSRQFPLAKLWLVGDGPFRERLYARIRDLDLRRSVAMPGSFDDLSDVLTAADLLVDPAADPRSPRAVLQAACLRRPVVGCHLETLRHTPLWDAGTARFASPTGADELCQAIRLMLDAPPAARSLSLARDRVLGEWACGRMVASHLQLFQRLCQ